MSADSEQLLNDSLLLCCGQASYQASFGVVNCTKITFAQQHHHMPTKFYGLQYAVHVMS